MYQDDLSLARLSALLRCSSVSTPVQDLCVHVCVCVCVVLFSWQCPQKKIITCKGGDDGGGRGGMMGEEEEGVPHRTSLLENDSSTCAKIRDLDPYLTIMNTSK